MYIFYVLYQAVDPLMLIKQEKIAQHDFSVS